MSCCVNRCKMGIYASRPDVCSDAGEGVARERSGTAGRASDCRRIGTAGTRAFPISGDVSRFEQPDSDQGAIAPIFHRPGVGVPRRPDASPARLFRLPGVCVRSRSSCRGSSRQVSCQVFGVVSPRFGCFGTHPVRPFLPTRIDSRRSSPLSRAGASS